MHNVCLLTSDDGLTSSLKRHFKYVRGFSDAAIFDASHLVPKDQVTRGKVLPVFRQIAHQIENEQGQPPSALRNLLIIVDLHDEELAHLEDLNPISREYGWAAVVAMLILVFPEAHWILHTPYSHPDPVFKNAHVFTKASSLSDSLTLHEGGFRNLLDGTGLRNSISSKIAGIEDDAGDQVAPVCRRQKTAAAIDEEEAYARFNAYAAYRFGYCAWSIDSWKLMQEVFRQESPGIHLLLEDLYLSFPDKNSDLSLSDLNTRDNGLEERPGLPGLRADSVERRILITVGHQGSEHVRNNWRKNRHYLRSLRAEKGRDLKIKVLYKPLAGIFNLWEKAGMLQQNGNPVPPGNGVRRSPSHKPRQNESTGHSTPGRLLVIAEELIQRSQSVLKEVRNVPDAVHAATLALEAKELLAGKTPTTALKALALQHRAEVVAESMFHGIEYNLDVESRFKEIKRQVEDIGQWFNARRRRRSTLNARLTIIEDLARTFRELNQFEEEQLCLREARTLSAAFWARQKAGRWLVWPILTYINFSLRSLATFVVLVLCWTAAFGLGYHFLEPFVMESDVKSFGEAFSASTVFFFTLQSAGDYWMFESVELQTFWNLFLAFQGVISLLHLGLLVSHVYIIISRR